MSKRLFSLMTVLVVASLVLAACGGATVTPAAQNTKAPAAANTAAPAVSGPGTVVIAPGDPIRVGISSGLTGPIPDLGQDTVNGALLAFDDVNAAGGIDGFMVESDLQDGACDGDQGTVVGNLFAADPTIVAVQGGLCTGETLGLRAVLEVARIPFVTASATFPSVTGPDWDTANRAVLADKAQGDADAAYVYNDLGITTVALINDSTDYGLGLATLFGDAFTLLGGTVTSNNGIQVGDTDFRSVLTQVAAENPGLIFFGGYATEAGLIASQKNEVGLTDVLFMSGDGAKTDQYIEAAGGAAEGTYISTSVGDQDPASVAAFNAKYEAKYGKAPFGPYNTNAYDAVMMITNAIAQVATIDSAGNLVIDREALIAAIRGTSGYKALNGTLTCDAIGDCGAGGIAIFKIENGAFVQVSGFGL